MPRRSQATFPKGKRFIIAAMGDSLTHNFTLGVKPEKLWPQRLASRLREAGCSVRAKNCAASGNTTAQMLARVAEMTVDGIPAVAVFFGGVNDPGGNAGLVLTSTGTTATATTAAAHGLLTGMQVTIAGATPSGYNGTVTITVTSATQFTYTVANGLTSPATGSINAGIPAAQTTRNYQAMAQYLKNSASGVVGRPADLPAGNLEGTRFIVVADNSTTGGLNPTGVTNATVTGTASGVQVWECRNALAGESGWSRVATATSPAVSRFIFCGPHFLNYTSGGDTAASGGSHSGQNAIYGAVDAAVRAAATAEGAVYSDLYNFLQQRILAGKDTAASASWHVAGTNTHLNAHGEDLVSQAVLATVQAQSGWTEALQ